MTDASERARLYARLPVTAAVDWWVDLATTSVDGRVLELGAGTGRLTEGLAAVAEVVAVDHDPASLAVLRERVPGVVVHEQDVRALDVDGIFGAVLLPVALLNEVGDLDDRRRTVAAAARHLAPGGTLACEVLNPFWLTAGDESSGEIVGADGDTVWMTAAHRPGDTWDQAVRADLTYRFADGAVLRDELDAHAVFPAELELLLASAGLTVTATLGSDPTSGDPPHPDDGSWYVTAQSIIGAVEVSGAMASSGTMAQAWLKRPM